MKSYVPLRVDNLQYSSSGKNTPRSGQSFGLSTVFGYKMVYYGH